MSDQMENKKHKRTDERMEKIQEMIVRFTQFDFNHQLPVSDKGDDLDAIIVGLNTLGEELKEKITK
jgi:hypothetical protein